MTAYHIAFQAPRPVSLATDELLGLGTAALAGLGALAIAVGSLLPLVRSTSFRSTYNPGPLITAIGLLGACALAVLVWQAKLRR